MMKRISLVIFVAASMAVVAQGTKVRKDNEDLPTGAKSYDFSNSGSDSTLEATTRFEYDANGNRTLEVSQINGGGIDSIVSTYNAQNLLLTKLYFEDGTLVTKDVWEYNTNTNYAEHNYIEYYSATDSMVTRTKFEGVKDFASATIVNVVNAVIFEVMFCDTLTTEVDSLGDGTWTTVVTFKFDFSPINPNIPSIANGRITLSDDFIDMFSDIYTLPYGMSIGVKLALTNNGTGLTKITGTVKLSELGMSDVDLFFINYGYNSGKLISEESILDVSMFSKPTYGSLYNYYYDGDRLMVLDFLYDAGEGDGYVLEYREWYIYPAANFIESPSELSLEIYPNPAVDYISIVNISDKSEVNIYDVTGRVVLHQTISDNTEISVSDLPAGIYICKIVNAKGEKVTRISKK
ncbi:MAG: T9SS type A sorting domain-containing protein [Bacteroidales bacterium]|jgi:antitoxin component YwqK of YwqJK toxin-antitoxin module|nr:T9SS type A sorting domain-containing protein [Bacteroidales bacterium]